MSPGKNTPVSFGGQLSSTLAAGGVSGLDVYSRLPIPLRGSHVTQAWPTGTSPGQRDWFRDGHGTRRKPMRRGSVVKVNAVLSENGTLAATLSGLGPGHLVPFLLPSVVPAGRCARAAFCPALPKGREFGVQGHLPGTHTPREGKEHPGKGSPRTTLGATAPVSTSPPPSLHLTLRPGSGGKEG